MQKMRLWFAFTRLLILLCVSMKNKFWLLSHKVQLHIIRIIYNFIESNDILDSESSSSEEFSPDLHKV